MSLTKKDKEEIKRLVAETMDEIREGKKYIAECNEKYDLELLTEKWNDSAIDTGLGFYIAPDNLKIGDKEYFTWDEAKEYEKKLESTGWRMPTVSEWTQMYGRFGIGEDGSDDPDALVSQLSLNWSGYSYGVYWSSTAQSTSYAYNLYFGSSLVHPQHSDNKSDRGFNVRMIKDKEVR